MDAGRPQLTLVMAPKTIVTPPRSRGCWPLDFELCQCRVSVRGNWLRVVLNTRVVTRPPKPAYVNKGTTPAIRETYRKGCDRPAQIKRHVADHWGDETPIGWLKRCSIWWRARPTASTHDAGAPPTLSLARLITASTCPPSRASTTATNLGRRWVPSPLLSPK